MKIVNFHPIFIENAHMVAEKLNLESVSNFKPQRNETYYVFGAHLKPSVLYELQKKIKFSMIIFQTEQLKSPIMKEKYYLKLLQHEKNIVLQWSPYIANKMLRYLDIPIHGFFDFQFIPRPINTIRSIDFFFCGTVTKKRKQICERIKKLMPNRKCLFDFNWSFVSNEKLTKTLLQTRYVLNIPYYEENSLETHRINKALSCGCLVLSCPSADEELNNKYHDYIHIGDILNMVKKIDMLPQKKKFHQDYIIKYIDDKKFDNYL